MQQRIKVTCSKSHSLEAELELDLEWIPLALCHSFLGRQGKDTDGFIFFIPLPPASASMYTENFAQVPIPMPYEVIIRLGTGQV